MAVIGRFNSLQVVKHTEPGLYLDGTQHGDSPACCAGRTSPAKWATGSTCSPTSIATTA
ncbi:hypothetical protein ACHWUR_00455 [Klebsiella pneumoniae]